MGDWETVPSGLNQSKKLDLLTEEGLGFDLKGHLIDEDAWWHSFDISVFDEKVVVVDEVEEVKKGKEAEK